MQDTSIPDGNRPRLRVGIVTLRNFTLVPFAGFIDVLRLATDDGDRSRQRACRWSIMSAGGRDIRASCGNVVRVDDCLRDPAEFDYIVVVGGLLHDGPQTDAATDSWLLEAASKNVPLVGLCTAVFTLIRLRLMSGRQCCVSWYHYWDLKKAFPDVVPVADRLFVVDGPRITCAGGTAAVDLAAWLVARHMGQGVADKALHILLADTARPSDSPQPQVIAAKAPQDTRLARSMALIEMNLAEPPSIEALASGAGISRRQLERLFRAELGVSPWQYSLHCRLQQAHWLLTRSARSVTDIAQDCGFADASHFARRMRAGFGASPQTLRDAAAACELGLAGKRFTQAEPDTGPVAKSPRAADRPA